MSANTKLGGMKRVAIFGNAGDYTDTEYPPTLEAAVRSGVRAAQIAIGKEA